MALIEDSPVDQCFASEHNDILKLSLVEGRNNKACDLYQSVKQLFEFVHSYSQRAKICKQLRGELSKSQCQIMARGGRTGFWKNVDR